MRKGYVYLLQGNLFCITNLIKQPKIVLSDLNHDQGYLITP
jgi:hypothetical protein